jgi:hypothetical protein
MLPEKSLSGYQKRKKENMKINWLYRKQVLYINSLVFQVMLISMTLKGGNLIMLMMMGNMTMISNMIII